MATEYGVVRLDKVMAVKYGNHIESLKLDSGNIEKLPDSVIENGLIAHAGDVVYDDERELREMVIPDSGNTIDSDPICVIAHSEVMYDESTRANTQLNKFYVEPEVPARGYKLTPGDIFSVSEKMIDAKDDEPEVGNYVVPQHDSFVMKEVEEVEDEKFYGKIVDKETIGTMTYIGSASNEGVEANQVTYYVIDVKSN